MRASLLRACGVIVPMLLLALPAAAPRAQTAYRHRDANGQWVFTDAAGATAPAADSINLAHEPEAVHIAVERADTSDGTQLIATSNCLCIVTVRVAIERSELARMPAGATYQATLQPGIRKTVAQAPHSGDADAGLQFTWSAALGSPQAVHSPPRPYRAPFAVGATFTVTQAYPVRITHVTPDSQYAVDFALPDGTPVYSAREGTVINVRHDSFRGSAQAAMLDQANVIQILHDDGTIAVYAHLQWDSIRVRIGQRVTRGEYIANSGNTGFTTGPHLHFAVWRNAGTADVSIPVQFARSSGDVGATAVTGTPLTAY
ncbi:MAG TPA: M23 family metallopeptidase [Steroidobacteraceae bacterium]|nr:M23 family metallopeptidase [Steroidobacteraceae bacterium]